MVATPEIDARVAELLRANDVDEAASVVLDAHGHAIFSMLIGIFHDEDVAQDVFQHFSLRVWKSLAKFEGRSSVYTWTYVIARRAVSAQLKGTSGREVRLVTEQERALAAKWTRTMTDEWRKTETKHRFRELCEGLPEEERLLVMLRIGEKMRWKQIAEIVNEGDDLDTEGLKRESSRLRKQFERVKERLRDAMSDA